MWVRLCTQVSLGRPQDGGHPWEALEVSWSPGTCLMAWFHPPEAISSWGHLHQMGQHRLVAGNSVSPLH